MLLVLATLPVQWGWSHLPCRVTLRSRTHKELVPSSKWVFAPRSSGSSIPSFSEHSPLSRGTLAAEVTLVTMWVTWSSQHFCLPLPPACPVAESGTAVSESALAQVCLAEASTLAVQGVRGQSHPSQACPLWRTPVWGTRCGPHTLITHFPPKAPVIPNG